MAYLQRETRDAIIHGQLTDSDLKDLAQHDDMAAIVLATCLQTQALRDLAALLGSDAHALGVTGRPVACGGITEDDPDEEGYLSVEFPVDKKIGCIKDVREFTGIGLKEAKDLVEGIGQHRISRRRVQEFNDRYTRDDRTRSFNKAWIAKKANESRIAPAVWPMQGFFPPAPTYLGGRPR